MNNFMDDYFSSSFAQGIQNFIIALIVLLIGWLIAKAIGNIVEKAMKKSILTIKYLINLVRMTSQLIRIRLLVKRFIIFY